MPTETLSSRTMAVVCYMVFFAVLNTTMFNVAIPDIVREFRLTPPEVSWVLTSYIAIFGMGAVVYGKLADAVPIKKLLTIGLALFNAGSVVGLFSYSFPMLVAGRILQGIGGSAISALAMIISIRYFPVAVRGRVLAAVSTSIACGGACGPIIGSFVAGTFDWRYLFLVSSLTLPAIPFFNRLLPDEVPRNEPFDYLGGALLGGAVVSFLIFVTESRLPGLLAGLIFFGGFTLRIHRAAAPFLMPELLRDRRYRSGLLTLFLAQGATIYGMMFTLPLLLRNLNHLGTQAIGLFIFPGAMTAAVVSLASGRLADRKGSVLVVQLGLAFLLVGYAFLSTVAGRAPYFIAMGLVVAYTGFSILQSSLARTVSLILPKEQAGVGMGMYSLTFFMSGAFGAALAGRMIEAFTHGPVINPFVNPAAGPYSNVFTLFFCMVACAAVIFRRAFGKGKFDERSPSA